MQVILAGYSIVLPPDNFTMSMQIYWKRYLSGAILALALLACAAFISLPVYASSSISTQVAPISSINTGSTQLIVTAFSASSIKIPLVKQLDGSAFDIGADKSYKVVYFYSNACPCVRNCETLTFKPLSAQYQGKVDFFAVVSGGWDLHDDHTNFMNLLETHHLPFPVLLDLKHQVADTLNGIASSQAVLLSPDNKVLFNGAADDSKEYTDTYGHLGHTKTYLADAIAQALSGQRISVPYVRPRGCSIDK